MSASVVLNDGGGGDAELGMDLAIWRSPVSVAPRARVDLSAEGTDKVGRRMKSGREKCVSEGEKCVWNREKCVWDKDNVGRRERSVWDREK